jgi:ankyrin repeat protein
MEFAARENNGDGENIWCAASDGDVARVTALLSSGVDVNTQDESGYSPMSVPTLCHFLTLMIVMLL